MSIRDTKGYMPITSISFDGDAKDDCDSFSLLARREPDENGDVVFVQFESMDYCLGLDAAEVKLLRAFLENLP